MIRAALICLFMIAVGFVATEVFGRLLTSAAVEGGIASEYALKRSLLTTTVEDIVKLLSLIIILKMIEMSAFKASLIVGIIYGLIEIAYIWNFFENTMHGIQFVFLMIFFLVTRIIFHVFYSSTLIILFLDKRFFSLSLLFSFHLLLNLSPALFVGYLGPEKVQIGFSLFRDALAASVAAYLAWHLRSKIGVSSLGRFGAQRAGN